MGLRVGMRAIEHVPRTVTPSAERHAIGTQRCTVRVLDEPVRMRAEQIRFLFRDERRYPNRRLESACTDIGEHGSHVAAERRAGLEPVAHCTLVAIVDLHVSEGGHGRRDDVEIVEHLLRGHAWPEAVPRTPAGRWRLNL